MKIVLSDLVGKTAPGYKLVMGLPTTGLNTLLANVFSWFSLVSAESPSKYCVIRHERPVPAPYGY